MIFPKTLWDHGFAFCKQKGLKIVHNGFAFCIWFCLPGTWALASMYLATQSWQKGCVCCCALRFLFLNLSCWRRFYANLTSVNLSLGFNVFGYAMWLIYTINLQGILTLLKKWRISEFLRSYNLDHICYHIRTRISVSLF